MLRVVESSAKTDTGRQRRANEDAWFEQPPVFAVADGMGGAQAGEVASKMAVEMLDPPPDETGSAEDELAARVREANRRIHELSRSDADRAGMGTTLTVARVCDHDVAVAHVGDSRAYLYRDGKLQRLTRDHSLVQALVDEEKITEEQAEHHPQRSIITRALGPEAEVQVDTHTHPAQAGDVFLLCSDGLTSMVGEERVSEILAGRQSLKEAAQVLIKAANDAGGRDNITVVLFRVDDVPEGAPVEQPTVVGAAAPTAAQMRVAVTEAPTPTVTRARGPERVVPPPLVTASPARRRRGRRLFKSILIVAAALAIVLVPAWIATRAVFFIGTNDEGLVTVFRGLPYDLPGGIELYEEEYVSGVTAATVPAARRRTLLDHKLRDEDEAADVVDKLERGQLRP